MAAEKKKEILLSSYFKILNFVVLNNKIYNKKKYNHFLIVLKQIAFVHVYIYVSET